MTFREWQLNEDLEKVIATVENLTVSVKEYLGAIDQSTLLELLNQVRRLRAYLDRLAYAVEATLPLAELEKQIAENETAERLHVERARAESAKATKG
jgi:hypothetical protein